MCTLDMYAMHVFDSILAYMALVNSTRNTSCSPCSETDIGSSSLSTRRRWRVPISSAAFPASHPTRGSTECQIPANLANVFVPSMPARLALLLPCAVRGQVLPEAVDHSHLPCPQLIPSLRLYPRVSAKPKRRPLAVSCALLDNCSLPTCVHDCIAPAPLPLCFYRRLNARLPCPHAHYSHTHARTHSLTRARGVALALAHVDAPARLRISRSSISTQREHQHHNESPTCARSITTASNPG
jgi:hypothetical protein